MEKNCKGWKVHSEMNKGVKPKGTCRPGNTKQNKSSDSSPNRSYPFSSPNRVMMRGGGGQAKLPARQQL